MFENKVVLAIANSYIKKYYLNPDFSSLPSSVQDELKIMCVLFTEEVGGSLSLVFQEDGTLCFEVSVEEGDILHDEIGSALKIKQLQSKKVELLQSLEYFYLGRRMLRSR